MESARVDDLTAIVDRKNAELAQLTRESAECKDVLKDVRTTLDEIVRRCENQGIVPLDDIQQLSMRLPRPWAWAADQRARHGRPECSFAHTRQWIRGGVCNASA